MTSDHYARHVLAWMHADVDRFAGLPAGELVRKVRPIVQRLLLAPEPDGSWPQAQLLHEALRSYLELIEAALDDKVDLESLDESDQRWVAACRQAADSYELFEDMLVDLRRDVPPPGPSVSG